MSVEHCFFGWCFIPLDASGPKIFGFSEYLTGLALMVLAWTIADVRYRFRIRTAPIPLQRLTFSVIAILGALTLLTDLWRAEEWLIPSGNLLSPASWQAILAGLFLLTFLTWAWFAFISPPKFGANNAKRFAQTLYRFVLRGSPPELAVIADEIAYSAKAIVRNATDRSALKNPPRGTAATRRHNKVEAHANNILLLIADKRLCRAIVESSPVTALLFFQEMSETKKYGIQIETFAKNIVNQALSDKNSFLYHEAKGYDSGFLGYQKPLSQAMFTNSRLVETIGTMLDPDMQSYSKWDADQWEAYCRAALMTFEDHVKNQFWSHSFVLYRATGYIENSILDIYKLNEVAASWDNDAIARLRVVINFIKKALKILDAKGLTEQIPRRVRERHSNKETLYDQIANMIFEVILHASAVRSPARECWNIQHNSVWTPLFSFYELDNQADRLVKFKVRRLLYEEITKMAKLPNFKGARILGFCLNVMGLNEDKTGQNRDTRALHRSVLNWTRKNYAWLYEYNPRIAEACLVEGITYETEKLRLVSTPPTLGLSREPHLTYLNISPPPKEQPIA